MIKRFKQHERVELEVFKDILLTVEDYLPLDFIVGIFHHMRDNPKGFDNAWVQRGVVTGKRVAQAHNLSDSNTGVLLAAVMLLETGRKFIGVDRREGSVAFAISFINKVIPGYFTDEEIKTISYCLRYNKERFRRSVDGSFVLLVSEVTILADVVFKDLENVVINYVRENPVVRTESDRAKDADYWHAGVASEIFKMYGADGHVWQGVTPATKAAFMPEINAFQTMAADAIAVKSAICQNYKRIYSR